MRKSCPVCKAEDAEAFHEVLGVPVHSVHLLSDLKQALDYPCHDIILHCCPECSFVFNAVFDPSKVSYGAGYDGSQSHSGHFRRFHQQLADQLRELYGLKNKHILEVGCGQGEFLALLCAGGANRGTGYDPAYVGQDRVGEVTFYREHFPASHRGLASPDLTLCKMTLEHIARPSEFVSGTGSGLSPGTPVFFQVPESGRILRDAAFWDVYYEHCCYFNRESLATLFALSGFVVKSVWSDYADQYLMLSATLGSSGLNSRITPDPAFLSWVADFDQRVTQQKSSLRARLGRCERALFWGAGSKAVAALGCLPRDHSVVGAVDVNPAKWGTYLAGSGLPVLAPDQVAEVKPDLVMVMNPVYVVEIGQTLDALGVEVKVESFS